MDIKFRLDLLLKGKQIDSETYDNLLETQKLIKEKWNIILTEENGQMMITHLAMAIMRIKRNESIEIIEESIYKETKESPYHDKANEMFDEVQKLLPIKFNEVERKYMIVHNVVLLEK